MTPERVLEVLQARLGPKAGEDAWLVVDEVLCGWQIYWPKRVGRVHRERCIYEQVKKGRRVEDVAAHAGVSTRTVRRIVKRTLEGIRARK